MKMLYFDHHTTSNVDPIVLDKMLSYLKGNFALVTQPGAMGQQVAMDARRAYKTFYHAIGAKEEDTIVLTSSHAESISQIFESVYLGPMKKEGKNHFITLTTEDAPTLMNLHKYEAMGANVSQIKIGLDGKIDKEKVIAQITPRTAFISLSLVSGLTGVMQSIEPILEILKERKILIHLDVSFAIGKVPIDAQSLDVDYLTCRSDVIGGPKSIALLYARKGATLSTFIQGSFEQNGLRGASLDVSQVIGFEKAIKLAIEHTGQMSLEMINLRNSFEKELKAKIKGLEILFAKVPRISNVSVISFPKVHADAMLFELNQNKLYATLGGGQFQKLSYMLDHMGFESKLSESALSFAFSRSTTKEEIKSAVEVIAKSYHKLSKLSEYLEAGL